MSYQATIMQVLISAPNDIINEIRIVNEVISTWNAINSKNSKKYLDLISWKTHAYPQAGSTPQDLLNRQIVNETDILIAFFWTRLGSPTEDYQSGTVEEIEKLIIKGIPVMVYFSKQPVSLDSVDVEQYKLVKEYCNKLKDRALYGEYTSAEELRNILNRHIGQVIGSVNQNVINENSDQKKAIESFLESIEQLYRKAKVEWTSEEKSRPVSTDDAKWIMKSIIDSLIDYRAMIKSDENGSLSSIFDDAIVLGKQLGQHQMFLDGGKSYKEFWSIGNEIIDKINEIATTLRKELQEVKEES